MKILSVTINGYPVSYNLISVDLNPIEPNPFLSSSLAFASIVQWNKKYVLN